MNFVLIDLLDYFNINIIKYYCMKITIYNIWREIHNFNYFSGFILANEGYDVWLGNSRGSFYGKGHVKLSVSDRRYWNFRSVTTKKSFIVLKQFSEISKSKKFIMCLFRWQLRYWYLGRNIFLFILLYNVL